MKKFLIVIVALCLGYGVAQAQTHRLTDTKVLLRCNMLFPNIGYFIKVYQNGLFEITYGGYNCDIDSVVNPIMQQKVELSYSDLMELKVLKSEILKMDECMLRSVAKGAWMIEVFVDDKEYRFYLDNQLGTPIETLQNKLKNMTPNSFLWNVLLQRY